MSVSDPSKIQFAGVDFLQPVTATQSSTLRDFSADKCIDGEIEDQEGPFGPLNPGDPCWIPCEGTNVPMCHTNAEPAPWIAIDFSVRVTIERVEIFNRQKCCGDRTQNIDVRISDELPTTGSERFPLGTLFGHFAGPGTDGQHIIISGQKLL